MESPSHSDRQTQSLVFPVHDLDEAAAAFLRNPEAHVIMASEGRIVDVGAAVRADDFASRALASLNATESYRHMAVRTAILLARPEKA